MDLVVDSSLTAAVTAQCPAQMLSVCVCQLIACLSNVQWVTSDIDATLAVVVGDGISGKVVFKCEVE